METGHLLIGKTLTTLRTACSKIDYITIRMRLTVVVRRVLYHYSNKI